MSVNCFNGGVIEKFNGSSKVFKESTSVTYIVVPTRIKLTLFSMSTRIFHVKLEYSNGFIEIPISMERLEEWEKG